MKVAFRADASVGIGIGHVMRCLTLAGELRRLGAEVHFLGRPHDGNLLDFIRVQEGFASHALGPADGSRDERGPAHSPWLGTTQAVDARQASAVLEHEALRPDWLIVDHYGIDRQWESAMRSRAGRILAIDDLADRNHDCDALLDQNLYPGMDNRYAGLVPPDCRLLLGPRHALLRREFAEARAAGPRKPGPVGRILIFFGGADPTDETSKALDALASLGARDYRADIVVGASNPNRERIRARCLAEVRLRYHFQVRNMAALMAAADLAIGAGGTTTWERCCLALPTLCITIADNQKAVARAAEVAGLLRYLGHHDEVGADSLGQALLDLFRDPSPLADMAFRSGDLVDGSGAARIARELAALTGHSAPGALSLRPAVPGDALTLHRWANDPETRKNAFNTAPIPLEDHLRWFESRMASPATSIFILECGGEPAGQIRFDVDGTGAAEVDFSVDGAFRGRGLGMKLLMRGMRAYVLRAKGPAHFLATVKRSNPASAKAFLGAGFALEKEAVVKGQECLIFSRRFPA